MEDFSESSRIVTTTALWTVVSVAPVLGPERGGTVLTLTGEGYAQPTGVACRFSGEGNVPLPARWINETTVVCVTRAHAHMYTYTHINVNMN